MCCDFVRYTFCASLKEKQLFFSAKAHIVRFHLFRFHMLKLYFVSTAESAGRRGTKPLQQDRNQGEDWHSMA